MINLAITAPSETEHPETFIQSHIDGIREHVVFYYGDLIPRYIKGEGLFSIDNKHLNDIGAWKHLLGNFNLFSYRKSGLGIKEYMFAHSLKKHNIDVVLAEYGTTGAEVYEACRYANIPLVVHFHGRDCTAYDNLKNYGERYKKMFAYASSVIAVSHDMERRLVILGCPKEKLVYAPCTPDPKFASLNASLEKIQFCFCGRFTDKKAPYATLLAFRKVLDKYPEAKLVMAGDGPLLNASKNIAKIIGAGDNVIFTGAITPARYQQILLESRAYVQHSITADDGDMEGTPVSVMEASAAGIPVISTFHAGIPDVIVDGKTGLLCKELDVESMAVNMLRLASDKEFALCLGAAGKKRMAEHFSKDWQMNVLTEAVEAASKRNNIL